MDRCIAAPRDYSSLSLSSHLQVSLSILLPFEGAEKTIRVGVKNLVKSSGVTTKEIEVWDVFRGCGATFHPIVYAIQTTAFRFHVVEPVTIRRNGFSSTNDQFVIFEVKRYFVYCPTWKLLQVRSRYMRRCEVAPKIWCDLVVCSSGTRCRLKLPIASEYTPTD